MSWATQRRLIIISILSSIAVAIVAVFFITSLNHTSSCAGNGQNKEEGCRGPLGMAPTVLFTKAIPNGVGRTDVIAEVENKNIAVAAKAVPYTISIYGSNNIFLRKVHGTIDLPPSSTIAIFVPGVASATHIVSSVFLSIDTPVQWYRFTNDTRIIPVVSNTTRGGTTDNPIIHATFTNKDTTPLTNVRAIVMVRDTSGNIIAASKTILPTISGQGTAVATFTWNGSFVSTPATIEVVPIIPLP